MMDPALEMNASGVDAYEPPMDRLRKAKVQFDALELEIQVLEHSGYARLGAFSKVFAMRLNLDQKSRGSTKLLDDPDSRHNHHKDSSMKKKKQNKKTKTEPKNSERRPPQSPTTHHEDDDGDEQRHRTKQQHVSSMKMDQKPDDDFPFPTLFESCDDQLYQHFYDDQGKNLFEQLLTCQMRILALTKLCFGKHSLALAKEELVMAETYARMDLWKQAHAHFVASTELFQQLESFTGLQTCNNNHNNNSNMADDGMHLTPFTSESFVAGVPALSSRDGLLLRVLYHFYQRHHQGQDELDLASLLLDLEKWTHEADEANVERLTSSLPSLEPLFSKASLLQSTHKMRPVVGPKSPSRLLPPTAGANSIHWQDFVLFLENHEPLYQEYVRGLEKTLSDMTLQVLRTAFTTLCCHHDVHTNPSIKHATTTTTEPGESTTGRVLLSALLLRLESLKCHDVFFGQLSTTLVRLQQHFAITHLTWSELMQHGRGHHLFCNETTAFQPRLKFFLARFCLKKGAVEESLRWIQLAIAEQQQLHALPRRGPGHGQDLPAIPAQQTQRQLWLQLAPFHLLYAEALMIRFKQKKIVASQTALAKAEKYLTSLEGSRAVRVKALQLIEQEFSATNEILLKKQAEKHARELLLQEVSSFSFIGPDQSLLDEALEHCCRINNELSTSDTHHGADTTRATRATHDASASSCCMFRIQSLVLMAQVHQLRNDLHETLVWYTKAIDLYEHQLDLTCCVPAIAWLRVEMAQILVRQKQLDKAKQMYQSVGEFFAEFAKEFAGCITTRRDCAQHAMDAFRAWLVLDDKAAKGGGDVSTVAEMTTTTRQDILQHIYATCQTNFGEFSLQAAQSGLELAKQLLTPSGTTTTTTQATGRQQQLRHALRLYRKAKYIVETHFGPNDRRCRRLGQQIAQLETQLKASLPTTQASQMEDMDHTWLVL